MVEVLCTITGIVAGVAIVASFMQSKGDPSRWRITEAAENPEQPGQMRGIADQLRLLSFRVAADVTAHSAKVAAINGRLSDSDGEHPDRILAAINELVAANQQMQEQLSDARRRIADQTQLIEETSQQARTDALTGLANRRALDEFLQSCIQATQPGECTGLLLLDIDQFKSFNDTYGHTTGDAVLAAFARNIKKFCNQDCYTARYGGEEFAVIMTGPNSAALAQKSSALRTHVSEQCIGYEDLQLKLTASAGLTLLDANDSLQSAYERADEGLYRAKKAGRDRGFWLNTTNWQPLPTEPGEAKGAQREKENEKAPDARTLIRQSASAAALPDELEGTKADSSGNADGVALNLADATADKDAADEGAARTINDVLDLASFMSRASVYFEQLRRAELPATGMLIAAQWNIELDGIKTQVCWNTVLELIQSQLRGIDVVCIYRANTACVFLPGCSMEAAIERAARIQALLESNRIEWEPVNHCPDRLSISLSQAGEREEIGEFLQRLEVALDEAIDVGRFELVVHSGDTTQVVSTIQA